MSASPRDAAPALPKPTPRGEERLYFEAAMQRRLVYQMCETCQSSVFYLREVCPHCGGESLQVCDSAGFGTVYSYTVQHRASHPYFADKTPMTLALVDLDEGFRLLANLTGVDDVVVGVPVQVAFEQVDDDLVLPHVRRREEEPR